MKTHKLFWIPRVLAILFILFLSIFALDVFEVEAPFIQKLVGFLVHLVPSFALIIALLVSWRKPLIGGTIFILMGLSFTFLFKTYQSLLTFSTISLPAIIIGALFIISQKIKR